MRLNVYHVTLLTFTTVLICSTICAEGSIRSKRHGLFLCSGWGASCASGWGYQTSAPKQPFRQRSRNQGNQARTLRQYWLTTEKSWGPPVGKRSGIQRSNPFLRALFMQNQPITGSSEMKRR